MGNLEEVTDSAKIIAEWHGKMVDIMKNLHNEHEKRKLQPLMEAIFAAEQAVRWHIMTKRDNDRRKDNDCSSLNSTLDKFTAEIGRIKELCPQMDIPSEMTHPMQKCLPKSQGSSWSALCPHLQECIDDFSRQADGGTEGTLAKWDNKLNVEASKLGLGGTAHAYAIKSWWDSVSTIRYCRANRQQGCREAIESAEKHIRRTETELRETCPNLRFPRP